MHISAKVINSADDHQVTVSTGTNEKSVDIPGKVRGSAINGGELLCAALATCYCNDIYREAGKRGINVTRVMVYCESEFGPEGEPGSNFIYKAEVDSDAAPEEIRQLILDTDKVAEIQNTLRKGVDVRLVV